MAFAWDMAARPRQAECTAGGATGWQAALAATDSNVAAV